MLFPCCDGTGSRWRSGRWSRPSPGASARHTAEPDRRLGWWLVALAIDVVGGATRHPLPGFSQPGLDDIRFDVAHQVERTRLFLLICFGEAIVRAGVGLAAAPQNPEHVAAALASMVSLICAWTLFFGPSKNYTDRWFGRRDRSSESRLGRLATYGQQFLVIAFVAYAVGTQRAVDDPPRPLGPTGTALLFGAGWRSAWSATPFSSSG